MKSDHSKTASKSGWKSDVIELGGRNESMGDAGATQSARHHAGHYLRAASENGGSCLQVTSISVIREQIRPILLTAYCILPPTDLIDYILPARKEYQHVTISETTSFRQIAASLNINDLRKMRKSFETLSSGQGNCALHRFISKHIVLHLTGISEATSPEYVRAGQTKEEDDL